MSLYEWNVAKPIAQVSKYFETYLRQGAEAQAEQARSSGENITVAVVRESDRVFRLEIEVVGSDGKGRVAMTNTYSLVPGSAGGTRIEVDNLLNGKPLGAYEQALVKKQASQDRSYFETSIFRFIANAEREFGGPTLAA